jgi:hypothetical protein
VEVGVAQAALGELIDVRRGDVGAEAAELGEADVVEHHDDDVRGAVGRAGPIGPVGHGVPMAGRDRPRELVWFHASSRSPGSDTCVMVARRGAGRVF